MLKLIVLTTLSALVLGGKAPRALKATAIASSSSVASGPGSSATSSSHATAVGAGSVAISTSTASATISDLCVKCARLTGQACDPAQAISASDALATGTNATSISDSQATALSIIDRCVPDCTGLAAMLCCAKGRTDQILSLAATNATLSPALAKCTVARSVYSLEPSLAHLEVVVYKTSTGGFSRADGYCQCPSAASSGAPVVA